MQCFPCSKLNLLHPKDNVLVKPCYHLKQTNNLFGFTFVLPINKQKDVLYNFPEVGNDVFFFEFCAK